jgi:hypothetical protein
MTLSRRRQCSGLASAFARKGTHRWVAAGDGCVGGARGGLAGAGLLGEGDAHVVQHGVLHGDLQMIPLPCRFSAIQCAQDRDRQQHPGAGVAQGWTRFQWAAVEFARGAHDAAARLGDHVECQVFLIRAAFAEAFDLAVDDRRIKGANHILAQPEPLDRARREILHQNVGLGGEVFHQLQTARVLQINRDRLFVGVEIQEIRIVDARLAAQRAAGIAAFGIFHLHDLGPHPGQGLGAGRPSLKLSHIQDSHTGETVAAETVRSHIVSPLWSC